MTNRLATSSLTDSSLMRWWVLAAAVFASVLAAEYLGPLSAVGFAIAICGFALLCTAGNPRVRFPAAGYWLTAILAVGSVSTVFADIAGATPLDADFQRDLGISLSYILFLVIGYYFASSPVTFRILLAAIVAAGFCISVVHLISVFTVLSSGVADLYLFRLEAGRGSVTQFAALCACVLLLCQDPDRFRRRVLRGCAALLMISMLLTLSRGLIMLLIILALGMTAVMIDQAGRVTVNIAKFLAVAAVTVLAFAAAYFMIMLFLPAVHDFIDEFFITRLVNTVTEVAASDLQTRTQITDNYRAFERDQAMNQFGEQSVLAQILGQGFGTVVEFGFETASSKVDFSRTEAAFLHNGYAYYLTKTGVLGLVLYVGLLVHLAVRALIANLWPTDTVAAIQRKMLLVMVFALAIGSVTTGGFGFPATHLGLAALLGACYGPLWTTDVGSIGFSPRWQHA
jgi:hypothetical protein